MARADVSVYNVAADEPGGTDVIIQLTGAQAIGSPNAPSAFQQSNSVTVDLTGAAANAQPSGPLAQDTWPNDWPQVMFNQASSDFTQNMATSPWREWNAERDLVIHQGRYPTSARLNEHAGVYATFKSLGPNCHIVAYTHMFGNFPGGTSKLQYLGHQIIEELNAEDEWLAFDVNGTLLWGDGDQNDMRMSNIAFHLT